MSQSDVPTDTMTVDEEPLPEQDTAQEMCDTDPSEDERYDHAHHQQHAAESNSSCRALEALVGTWRDADGTEHDLTLEASGSNLDVVSRQLDGQIFSMPSLISVKQYWDENCFNFVDCVAWGDNFWLKPVEHGDHARSVDSIVWNGYGGESFEWLRVAQFAGASSSEGMHQNVAPESLSGFPAGDEYCGIPNGQWNFFDNASSATAEPRGMKDSSEAQDWQDEPHGLCFLVREAVEKHMEGVESGTFSLVDLLHVASVTEIFGEITETLEQLQTLKLAIERSDRVDLYDSLVVLRQAAAAASSDAPTHVEGFVLAWPEGDSGDPNELVPVAIPMATLAALQHDGVGSSEWDSSADADWVWPQTQFDQHLEGMGDACWFAEGDGWPDNQQKAKPDKTPEKRRRAIYRCLEKTLRFPSEDLAKKIDSEGWVYVEHLLEFSRPLAQWCFNRKEVLYRVLRHYHEHNLVVDEEYHMVRHKTNDERICAVAEIFVKRCQGDEPALLADLLEHKRISSLLRDVSASSNDGVFARLQALQQALMQSDVLQITEDKDGREAVVLAPERLLREVAETFIDRDRKALTKLKANAEIPLSWILEQPAICRALDRSCVEGEEAGMEVLRRAFAGSTKYVLDAPLLSIRSAVFRCARPPPRSNDWSEAKWLRVVPRDRDAKEMQSLLSYYFSHFNLQHMKLLMAVVQAHFERQQKSGWDRRGRSSNRQSDALRPIFSLQDLRGLPRLSALLDLYRPEAWPSLLAAAAQMQRASEMPVRVCTQRKPGAARGAWAVGEPTLELTYEPNFRYMQIMRPDCPEAKAILEPTDDPDQNGLPDHVFSVVSYSVSSDISHSQSPKAADLLDEIMSGSLDPKIITWEYRQQLIKRQLVSYAADIICVQGLQSVGFAERCSEDDPAWFTCDAEPTTNHLVHLYRQLSKSNYGVTFAPTMKQPGSGVACFGNAIFWRRERWQLGSRISVPGGSAVCVELISRLKGPRLFVCSSKSAACYAREFGDAISDMDLAYSVCAVQAVIAEAVRRRTAAVEEQAGRPRRWASHTQAGGQIPRLLWCGDFGCELIALLEDIDDAAYALLKEKDASIEAATVSLGGFGKAQKDNSESDCDASSDDDGKGLLDKSIDDTDDVAELPEWRSASMSVLGREQWTSVSQRDIGKCVDYILHDTGLETLAVLSGCHREVDLVDNFRPGADQMGNPSDHLPQLAVFVDGYRQNPSLQQSLLASRSKRGANVWPTLGARQHGRSPGKARGPADAEDRPATTSRGTRSRGRLVSRSGSVSGGGFFNMEQGENDSASVWQ